MSECDHVGSCDEQVYCANMNDGVILALEKELAEARQVIEERGHAFQKAVNDALLDRDKYKRLCERLDDALYGMAVYANDTLSGRAEGPTDLDWYVESVKELYSRAKEALAAYEEAVK